MIAHSKEQGSGRESNEERLLRLFVVVSKELGEEELRTYFGTFGTVQYVNIVKDRDTKESKGFAYIKFYRLVHAAKAFELCDKSYKAVFAEPRPARPDDNHHHPGRLTNGYHHGPGPRRHPVANNSGSDSCRLTVLGSSSVNEDQLWRLFDLIPGLDYCEVDAPGFLSLDLIQFPPQVLEIDQPNQRIVGLAVYTSSSAAAYARRKLHGFEYPPGQRLIVRGEDPHTPPPATHKLPGDLQSLAQSIAQATSLIQAANFQDSTSPPLPPLAPLAIPSYDPSYCSVPLPSPRPLVPPETPVLERLFLVCAPSPPPLYALKDVFSRFGGLIDVYLLKGKRCGYALFSSKEGAKEARSALDSQEVVGSRLKVLLAEPSKGLEKEAGGQEVD